MKILQVNKLYHPWIGGIERVAEDIAVHFNSVEGTTIVNLVCQPQGRRTRDLVNGVTTYRAGSWGMVSGMPISFDFFRLFRVLVKDADILILHHPFPLAFVAYRLLGRRKKVVVWYHSDIIRQKVTKAPFIPFIRSALKSASHIFVSANALIRTSVMLGDFSEKCRVVRFGIDTKRFVLTEESRASATRIRAEYGQPLVLSVGRLVYYKGFSYLIDAMKSVPAHLLIIGAGPLRDDLIVQIAEAGLTERVHLIDPVENLVPYYQACDVFALSSCEPSETFGVVQIEAMACGKPVVNTSLASGVPEVGIDGVTGRTVPAKNSQALAIALREILSDKKEYQRLSEGARSRVEGLFTKERFGLDLEKYLLPDGNARTTRLGFPGN